MPSPTHETLVALFRDCPSLALELLRQKIKTDFPRDITARETAAEFADLKLAEYRADVVVRLDLDDGKLAGVLIVEIQLDRDGEKRFTWPLYEASARARLRCPATVLVITLDQAVAKWCAEPIVLGPSGNTWRPLVLGPSELPRIDDENEARKHPELAVLSAAARAHEPDNVEAVAAALSACECLDNERATLYADLIFARLGEATLHALEAFMELRKHQYQSDFAKKYFAEGRKEGHKEGHKEGREQELRAVLQRQLAQRFGELPLDIQQRIAQAEIDELEQWIERVIPAESLANIFANG